MYLYLYMYSCNLRQRSKYRYFVKNTLTFSSNYLRHFIRRYGEKQRRADSQGLSGIQLLSATAYQLKKPYQQLLIPITIWIGMEQAFIGAEFTSVISYFYTYFYTSSTCVDMRSFDKYLLICTYYLPTLSIIEKFINCSMKYRNDIFI